MHLPSVISLEGGIKPSGTKQPVAAPCPLNLPPRSSRRRAPHIIVPSVCCSGSRRPAAAISIHHLQLREDHFGKSRSSFPHRVTFPPGCPSPSSTAPARATWTLTGQVGPAGDRGPPASLMRPDKGIVRGLAVFCWWWSVVFMCIVLFLSGCDQELRI